MARPDYYGLSSQRGQARRRSGLRGSMRLGVLFTVLVVINIYVFFFRGGTSIHDVLKASSISKKTVPRSPKTALAPPSQGMASETSSRTGDSTIIKGSMKGYLGLSTAILAHKLDGAQVEELIAALRPVLNMRSLKPEQTFEIWLDPKNGRLRTFIYHLSALSTITVTRTLSGSLNAVTNEKELTKKEVRLGGRIESSLDQALSKLGENSALVAKFVNLFSWDINWYTDPREDDEFRIIIEKEYLGDRFYRYGRILAAEYKGNAGRFQAYYFKTRDGHGGHFVPEGRSIQRAFLKTPLHFKRVSSRFNKNRFHPVLHQTKGHFGVDYAAPTGTTIFAAADGTVISARRSGGAGNMVVLTHSGGVQTIYMHLSRFAKGLKAGQKVRQRQVIGYVGTTGLSTGPHLHYGIKLHGRYIDPMKFTVGKGSMLPKHERIRFLDSLPDRMSALESIPVRTVAANES